MNRREFFKSSAGLLASISCGSVFASKNTDPNIFNPKYFCGHAAKDGSWFVPDRGKIADIKVTYKKVLDEKPIMSFDLLYPGEGI